jgi:hypothetical protein
MMKISLLLIAMLTTSCANRVARNQSMFLYFPKSINSLLDNGYKQQNDDLFSKKNVDTLENIQIYNLDSGQFSKNFYVRIRTTDTTSMVDFIDKNADSVLLRLNHVMLIRQQNNLYLITHGYSGNKTMYLLAYRNIKVYNDKILAVESLKKMLEWYPDSTRRSMIYKALTAIDPNWKTLPENTDTELGVPSEIKE